MTRLALFIVIVGLVGFGLAPDARAQQGLAVSGGVSNVGAEGSVTAAPTPGLHSNPGVKLSEEAVLHAGIGASGGYDSNVFFNNDNKVTSPILEISPSFSLTNADRTGGMSAGIYYDLNASLLYREYLSDDENVKAQRSFNPTVGALLQTGSQTVLGFGLSDQFTRLQEPPYISSMTSITRDNNLASARLRIAPGGGRLAGVLQYSNALQIFENTALKYADVMGHELSLDLSWKWLPKTALYIQVAQGIISYLEKDPARPRPTGYPFRAVAGVRGLVTSKLSASVAAGYAIGNYQDSVNPSGLSNLVAAIDLSWAPTSLTGIGTGYKHEFQNSPVLGTYYNSDSAYLGLRQSIASRLIFGLSGRYEYRQYRGPTLVGGPDVKRNDNLVSAGALLDYYIQQWFYAGVSYNLGFNDSDVPPAQGGIDYTKQVVLGRVGVVY